MDVDHFGPAKFPESMDIDGHIDDSLCPEYTRCIYMHLQVCDLAPENITCLRRRYAKGRENIQSLLLISEKRRVRVDVGRLGIVWYRLLILRSLALKS